MLKKNLSQKNNLNVKNKTKQNKILQSYTPCLDSQSVKSRGAGIGIVNGSFFNAYICHFKGGGTQVKLV